MANTRSSLKRARQNVKRNTRNKIIRSNTKSTVRNIVDLVKTKAQDALDPQKIYSAYLLAVKTLSKAASRHAIPKKRASRKIARLTRLIKKIAPQALVSK